MNLTEQFEQAWKDAQEVKSSEAKPSEQGIFLELFLWLPYCFSTAVKILQIQYVEKSTRFARRLLKRDIAKWSKKNRRASRAVS